MNLPRIENIDVQDRRIFLRADFNLPLENKDEGFDDVLLRKAIPTIDLLVNKGAKLIIGSSLGRLEGKVNPKYSMSSISERLSGLLGKNINFIDKPINSEVTEYTQGMKSGEICMLENLGFYKEEAENPPEFAKKLSELADIYINDSFSDSNKELASTVGITKHLPSYSGSWLYREVEVLSNLLIKPDKPFVAILGGSQISSKEKLLDVIFSRANIILIGGAMSYTFLKSKAVPVGSSFLEKDFEVKAFQIMNKAGLADITFELPIDHVIAEQFHEKAKIKTVDRMGIPDGWFAMDIGPKTIAHYEKIIKNAGTVFWNGSMGVVEMRKFTIGTKNIAKALAKSNAKTIVSGFNSIGAVVSAGVNDKIFHLSTGNDACLDFIAGKPFPALEALLKQGDFL
ncbi:MAG: phosphoglycerate kinase [Leptospiraceae bacterium]|nr:phosphoglycerate kinase [Leptospiraceae bacterium]MCP5493405.1 phosphoglycerate kinase [Leptospiraceae bacterium]